MHSKKIKDQKLKIYSHKQLLFFLFISMGIICPSYLISEPLTQQRFNKVDTYSDRSFITKALVMKDLSEYVSTLLNLCCVNGSEIKYDGHIIPIEMNKKNSNCLWL